MTKKTFSLKIMLDKSKQSTCSKKVQINHHLASF